MSDERSEPPLLPLLFRLPDWAVCPVLALFALGPCLTSRFIHPLVGGLLGLLAAISYHKIRYGGGRFGPLWLEGVDLVVLLGNSGLFLVVAGLTLLRWFW